MLLIRVNSDILIYSYLFFISIYSYIFINNSGNNGQILELFFKHIRISPQIHCHHLQLNPRSVEASREMATSGVNISTKWNSQNGSIVFFGSPKGSLQKKNHFFCDKCHTCSDPPPSPPKCDKKPFSFLCLKNTFLTNSKNMYF